MVTLGQYDVSVEDINEGIGVAERIASLGLGIYGQLTGDGGRGRATSSADAGRDDLSNEQLALLLQNRQTGATNYIPWIAGGAAALAAIAVAVVLVRR